MMIRFAKLRNKFEGLLPDEQEQVLELPTYLMSIEEAQTTAQTITNLDFMEIKVEKSGVNYLIGDYDRFCTAFQAIDVCKLLEKIRDFLVTSAHILQKSPQQLREQLLGRLPSAQIDELERQTGQKVTKSSLYLRPIHNTLATSDRLKYTIRTNKFPHKASLSGDIAVISTGGGIEAWDISTHDRLWNIEDESIGFRFCLSSDRAVTSIGSDLLVFIDIHNGNIVRKMGRPDGTIWAMDVDHNHHLIILAYDDGRMAALDLETGRAAVVIKAHDEGINGIVIARSGEFCITVSADGTVKAWAIPSLSLVASMNEVHEYTELIESRTDIRSVDISPDGSLAISGGYDVIGRYDVSVWDTREWKCLKRIPAHKQFIECVRFVDNHRLLSSSWDHTVKLLDVRAGRELCAFAGHSDWVLDVSSVDRGLFLSASKDGFVNLWSLYEQETSKSPFHANGVTRLLLGHDDDIVISCGYDSRIKKWNVKEGVHEFDFEPHEIKSSEAVISHDGKSLLIDNIGPELVTCNIETGAVISVQPFDAKFRPFGNPILGLEVGSLIIPTSAGGFVIWDYFTGRIVHECGSFSNKGMGLMFGGDVLIYGYCDNNIQVDFRKSGDSRLLKGHSDTILNVCHCGGHLFSTSVDKTLKIWDVSSCKLVKSCDLGVGSCETIAVSKSFVATVYEGFQIGIWDVNRLELAHLLPGHLQDITYMEWLLPPRLLASASADMTIKVWDVQREKLLCEFTIDAPVAIGTYSQKNRTVIVGDSRGRVHFFSLNLPYDFQPR